MADLAVDSVALDLAFEDARAGLALGPDGDLALVGGADALEQRLLHALVTTPGTVPYFPDDGAGAEAAEGGPGADARALERRVRAQLARDADVREVRQVLVRASDDGAVTYVSAAVATRAAPDATTPLAFTLGSP